MKIVVLVVFVILIDIITIALCKAAKRGDRALKHPERITLREDK